MILVTAALGNQGRLLIPKLAASGLPVRAWARSAASAARLERLGATETVAADLMSRDAIDRAMQGVDLVYYVGPNAHPYEDEIGFAMIEAAQAAGVRHFVFSSVLHPHIGKLSQHLKKLAVEERLFSSGLAYTILQPAHFMQTLQHRAAFDEGIFRLTWSLDRRQSLIDLDDVTDIAASIFREPTPHAGATYEMSSDDCLTAYEIADAIASVAGCPIATEKVSPAQVIESVFGSSDPALFRQRVELFEVVAGWYNDHDFVGNANVAQMLLGRSPNDLRSFLQREHASWMRGGS